MYYILGNSPKKVELKDLNDCIYYKQQKVYTDTQYEQSVDLRHAIQRGSVIVLKKSEDTTGSFDPNTVISTTSTSTIPQEIASSPKIDILLEKIRDLEEKIKSQPEKDSSVPHEFFVTILERLEKLEKNPAAIDLSTIQDTLKKIEDRVQGNSSDGLLEKLENILKRSGGGGGSAPVQEPVSSRVEEIYVPNIRVEDANSHINLEVRTLDSGDNVSDSLKKLRELRSKSK
jgi:hypothetical protein